MKKLLVLLLALAMTLCVLPALAAEVKPEPGEPAQSMDEDAVARAILDVLDEDAFRAAYNALLSGETVQKGSKGDTAKALQQTLIALGQPIEADGNVGPKTMTALKATQAAFGLEQTVAVDAGGYAQLLTRQLIATDEAAAEALLRGAMSSGEFDYARGCALFAQGRYYGAKQAFEVSGLDDWEARVAACAQPWPKTGVLYRNPDMRGDDVKLTVRSNCDSDTAMLAKIYIVDDASDFAFALVCTLFIGGTDRVTVTLPAAEFYAVEYGTGAQWYGEKDTFGEEGRYEAMTFPDGSSAGSIYFCRGDRSAFTVIAPEIDYDMADNTSSFGEDWGNFSDDVGFSYEDYNYEDYYEDYYYEDFDIF